MKMLIFGIVLFFCTVGRAETKAVWTDDLVANGEILFVHETGDAIDACHDLKPTAELPSQKDYLQAKAEGVFEKYPLTQNVVGYMTSDSYYTTYFYDSGYLYKPEIYKDKYMLYRGMVVVIPQLLMEDSAGAVWQTDNHNSGYPIRCIRR